MRSLHTAGVTSSKLVLPTKTLKSAYGFSQALRNFLVGDASFELATPAVWRERMQQYRRNDVAMILQVKQAYFS